jgi:hypothetical protein
MKRNSYPVKGMIFAGCSFTWGQGLYYYSNLPTLKEPPEDRFFEELVNYSHFEYAKTVRYPRLVANYFNTFELVHPKNGGSNQSAVNWWETCFNKEHNEMWQEGFRVPKLHYSEISHLIFQFTQWQRDNFIFIHNGKEYNIPFHETSNDNYSSIFTQWLIENGKTVDQWIHEYKINGVQQVKQFLQKCEKNGIKTFVFCWPSNLLTYIENDPWLLERLITFEYNEKNYKTIEDMMSPSFMHDPQYNPELTIKWDQENFEITPKDHHPSLKCHQVMAENIIKHIEKDHQ